MEILGEAQACIENKKESCVLGESIQLAHKVFPENATRTNTLWFSENPEIARIDKFGLIKTHQKGRVTITIYSWSDAYPLADNQSISFKKDGIKDSFELIVK